MSNLRGSLSSCLTVVAFIVLAVLAARFYSNTNQAANLDTSAGNQNIQKIANTVWSYAKVIASVNLIKNVGVGNATLEQNVKKEVVGPGLNSYDIETNRPLVDLTNPNAKIEANIEKGTSSDLSLPKIDLNSLGSADIKEFGSMFNYQKTTEGAELIIRSKNGSEYKLPLPFKFLAY